MPFCKAFGIVRSRAASIGLDTTQKTHSAVETVGVSPRPVEGYQAGSKANSAHLHPDPRCGMFERLGLTLQCDKKNNVVAAFFALRALAARI